MVDDEDERRARRIGHDAPGAHERVVRQVGRRVLSDGRARHGREGEGEAAGAKSGEAGPAIETRRRARSDVVHGDPPSTRLERRSPATCCRAKDGGRRRYSTVTLSDVKQID